MEYLHHHKILKAGSTGRPQNQENQKTSFVRVSWKSIACVFCGGNERERESVRQREIETERESEWVSVRKWGREKWANFMTVQNGLRPEPDPDLTTGPPLPTMLQSVMRSTLFTPQSPSPPHTLLTPHHPPSPCWPQPYPVSSSPAPPIIPPPILHSKSIFSSPQLNGQ